jgi:hypothetical protein
MVKELPEAKSAFWDGYTPFTSVSHTDWPTAVWLAVNLARDCWPVVLSGALMPVM